MKVTHVARIGFSNSPFRRPSIYRYAGELSITINGECLLVKIAPLGGWLRTFMSLREALM
jgi:hypothetical protein